MEHNSYDDPIILLKDFIKENKLKPGDRLPTQPMLCDELSISIRKLRDGLNILRQEGLLETRKKGGTVLLDPDVSFLYYSVINHLELKGYEYEDLVRARAIFESGAVKEVCQKRTARDLLKILDRLEALDIKNAKNSVDEQEDLNFHLEILVATHNPVLEIFGTIIAKVFFPKMKNQFKAPVEIQQKSNKEHHLIFEAILNQDETKASKLLYDHIIAPLKGRKIKS